MIEIIATAAIAAPLGFLTCAFLTAGKVADLDQDVSDACDDYCRVANTAHELRAAHTRATDALNAKTARIDRLKTIASSQKSIKSGRIIAVLSGEG